MGPCSLIISKRVLVIVCLCSGGVFRITGPIFGFGFFAKHRIAVPNILLCKTHFHMNQSTHFLRNETEIAWISKGGNACEIESNCPQQTMKASLTSNWEKMIVGRNLGWTELNQHGRSWVQTSIVGRLNRAWAYATVETSPFSYWAWVMILAASFLCVLFFKWGVLHYTATPYTISMNIVLKKINFQNDIF